MSNFMTALKRRAICPRRVIIDFYGRNNNLLLYGSAEYHANQHYKFITFYRMCELMYNNNNNNDMRNIIRLVVSNKPCVRHYDTVYSCSHSTYYNR